MNALGRGAAALKRAQLHFHGDQLRREDLRVGRYFSCEEWCFGSKGCFNVGLFASMTAFRDIKNLEACL